VVPILTNDTTGDTIVPTTVVFTNTGTGIPPTNGGKEMIVPGQGTWTIDGTTGIVTFVPEAGFIGDPTPPTYTGEDAEGNVSNEATITLSADPLPVASNDVDSYTPGVSKVVPILTNDTTGDMIVPTTVVFTNTGTGIPPTNGGKEMIVPGQGTWTIDGTTGIVTFVPEAGFTGDPTPPTYTGEDAQGNVSNEATITLSADPLPVASNDVDSYTPGVSKVVPILTNDTTGDTIVPTTVVFTNTGTGIPPTNGGKEMIVPGQGTWTIDGTTGIVTFVPEGGFTGDPTPTTYTGEEA
jgi:CshA-type fibril repeat protein